MDLIDSINLIKNSEWIKFITNESKKDYFDKLNSFLKEEYSNYEIFPNPDDIFNAFKFTGIKDTKVIIVGQDCYHGDNQAMGLSFSVPDGVKIPPSLINIYKELNNDIGKNISLSGDLTEWAKQGVFLLNACLTVRKHEPNSHAGKGWEIFTDNTISMLNNDNNPKVFILWGKCAGNKKSLITNKKHLILESVHPSPLSVYRGFFGCKHFSKTNNFLIENNRTPITW